MGALGEALGVPRAALGAPRGDLGAPRGLLGGAWGLLGSPGGPHRKNVEKPVVLFSFYVIYFKILNYLNYSTRNDLGID